MPEPTDETCWSDEDCIRGRHDGANHRYPSWCAEKKAPKSGAAAFGAALGKGIPLALMAWAAVETSGVLRWALIAWVAFAITVNLATASGWRRARGCYRPTRATRAG